MANIANKSLLFFPVPPSGGGGGGAHASTHAYGGDDPVTLTEAQITDLETDLGNKVETSTQVIAGSGLTGGGDLSSDVTLSVNVIDATQHGAQTDGTLHAEATALAAGFMAPTAFTKLSGIASGATNTPLGTASPSDVGTTSAGTAGNASHEDHVHGHGNQAGGSLHSAATTGANGFMSSTDKSKLDGVASSATNTPLGTASPSDVGTTSAGTAGSASHEDHVHAHGNQLGGTLHSVATTGVNGFLSSTDKTKLDGVASGATNTPLGTANPSDIGTTSAGTAGSASHEDHVHAHGNQGGGTQHSAATTGVNGFMSSSDKSKLDGVASGATNTPLGSATPSALGTAGAGSATNASHEDHVHNHGDQTGGSLHADATQSVAGFLPSTDKLKIDTGVANLESNDIILIPTLGRTIGARIAIATYYGASFPVPVKCSFTKVWLMLSAAANIGSQIRCTIYQKADGTAGTAALVATGYFTTTATGAQVIEISMSGTLVPGVCWILYGLNNALNSSVRVYTTASWDLLNQNIPTGKYPVTFTTSISSNGAPPSTFDPVGDATTTTSDVAALIRLGS